MMYLCRATCSGSHFVLKEKREIFLTSIKSYRCGSEQLIDKCKL